jgi:uncharacterized protein YodC (DUF2158 family)
VRTKPAKRKLSGLFHFVDFDYSCISTKTEVYVSEIKAGDVVVLKSGSPLLTVAFVNGHDVRCQWFDQKDLKQGDFMAQSLKHPEKESAGSLASRLA